MLRALAAKSWKPPSEEPGFDDKADRFSKGYCMTTAPVRSPLVVEGPPDPDLIRIRDLVYQVAGIFHPDSKLRLLRERCERRIKDLHAPGLRDYFECLT